MINKKLTVLIFLILGLLAVSAVSASEVDNDSAISEVNSNIELSNNQISDSNDTLSKLTAHYDSDKYYEDAYDYGYYDDYYDNNYIDDDIDDEYYYDYDDYNDDDYEDYSYDIYYAEYHRLPSSSMYSVDSYANDVVTGCEGVIKFSISDSGREHAYDFNIYVYDENGDLTHTANLFDSIAGERSYKIPAKSVHVLGSYEYVVKNSYDGNIMDYGYFDVIPKITTKLTAPNKSFKTTDKTKKYSVTLKDKSSSVIKNTKVTLKVNGVTYTAKTNAKGVATFKLSKLTKKGTYKATVKFSGSKKYKSVSKKATISVKKKSASPTVKNGKYKNKNSITLTVKDGKKTVKIKCIYKKSYKQYLGTLHKNGKIYSAYIAYEKNNKMQNGKKGWWTSVSNGGMSDDAKVDFRHNLNHPVIYLKLH